MDNSDLLTLFRYGVPLTWLLFVPAVIELSRHQLYRNTKVLMGWILLLLSAAALAVVTLDAMRAGVW